MQAPLAEGVDGQGPRKVWYDEDGSGSHAKVLVAIVTGDVHLTKDDFVVGHWDFWSN